MRASVAAAWPAMCKRYEGVTTWLYLDTKGKVTTGVGFLVDTIAGAQALPWWRPDGTRANTDDVAAEWRRVKAAQKWKHLNGLNSVWVKSARLALAVDTVNVLLESMTPRYWSGVVKSAPNVEQAPADAQLALLDLSWQNGAAFLNGWPDTRAAVRAADWSEVARLLATFLPPKADRTARRIRLLRNAAAVVRLGLDPEVLWDTNTPKMPTVPPAPRPPDVEPAPIPAPGPAVPPPAPAPVPAPAVKWSTSKTYGGARYRKWRGGNMTPTGIAVCEAIPTYVDLVQGGLQNSAVKASARTHNGLGAYDIGVRGLSKKATEELCSQLDRSGECAYPRGGLFGSPFFTSHVHVASANDYASLHPEAQAQVRDFKAKPRRNGLAGRGRYVGPSTPLGSWSDSPYNPKNIKAPDAARYVVSVGELIGLDVDRKPKKARARGFEVDADRLVRRWGRWNVVTTAGTFYAIADDRQTYLQPLIPPPAAPAPAPNPSQEPTP